MSATISIWALWLESQRPVSMNCAGAAGHALRQGVRGPEPASASSAINSDVFPVSKPETDNYLGRLCSFSRCPKDKGRLPGSRLVGAIPFNKRVMGFETARRSSGSGRPERCSMSAAKGRLRSALDLPTVADERPLRRKKKKQPANRVSP